MSPRMVHGDWGTGNLKFPLRYTEEVYTRSLRRRNTSRNTCYNKLSGGGGKPVGVRSRFNLCAGDHVPHRMKVSQSDLGTRNVKL